MKELVKVYKALADASRLRVLNLLLERECCVCEVVQALEVSQSKASRMLTALYGVGFLKLRKEGLWSLYSIDWDGMEPYLKHILEAASESFKGDRQMEIDRRNLANAERIGISCIRGACQAKPADEASRSSI
jgi:ArsR family transcriptional regulator